MRLLYLRVTRTGLSGDFVIKNRAQTRNVTLTRFGRLQPVFQGANSCLHVCGMFIVGIRLPQQQIRDFPYREKSKQKVHFIILKPSESLSIFPLMILAIKYSRGVNSYTRL